MGPPGSFFVPLNVHQHQKFATLDEFKQQWDAATDGFLKYVDFEGAGALVAGGVVETCLQSLEGTETTIEANISKGGRSYGDVDVFSLTTPLGKSWPPPPPTSSWRSSAAWRRRAPTTSV